MKQEIADIKKLEVELKLKNPRRELIKDLLQNLVNDIYGVGVYTIKEAK